MITETILNFLISSISYFVQGLFFLIPDFDFITPYQSHISSAISWFLGLVNYMNPIIPSWVSLSLITFYFSFYSIYFSFKFISWVLRKIPALGIS